MHIYTGPRTIEIGKHGIIVLLNNDIAIIQSNDVNPIMNITYNGEQYYIASKVTDKFDDKIAGYLYRPYNS